MMEMKGCLMVTFFSAEHLVVAAVIYIRLDGRGMNGRVVVYVLLDLDLGVDCLS
jgi:hypothetical protein